MGGRGWGRGEGQFPPPCPFFADPPPLPIPHLQPPLGQEALDALFARLGLTPTSLPVQMIREDESDSTGDSDDAAAVRGLSQASFAGSGDLTANPDQPPRPPPEPRVGPPPSQATSRATTSRSTPPRIPPAASTLAQAEQLMQQLLSTGSPSPATSASDDHPGPLSDASDDHGPPQGPSQRVTTTTGSPLPPDLAMLLESVGVAVPTGRREQHDTSRPDATEALPKAFDETRAQVTETMGDLRANLGRVVHGPPYPQPWPHLGLPSRTQMELVGDLGAMLGGGGGPLGQAVATLVAERASMHAAALAAAQAAAHSAAAAATVSTVPPVPPATASPVVHPNPDGVERRSPRASPVVHPSPSSLPKRHPVHRASIHRDDSSSSANYSVSEEVDAFGSTEQASSFLDDEDDVLSTDEGRRRHGNTVAGLTDSVDDDEEDSVDGRRPLGQRLNRMLRENGFSGLLLPRGEAEDVADTDGSAAMAAALERVLTEYRKRSRLVTDLVQASDLYRMREKQKDAALRRALAERDAARDAAKRQAVGNEVRRERERHGEEADRTREESSRRQVIKLQNQVARLTKMVRQREGDVEQVKRILSEREEQQARREKRHAEIYERLKRAHAASRADTGRHHGSSSSSSPPSLQAAVRDLRPLELVGLYESQRETVERELDALRLEHATLRQHLLEAEGSNARLRDRLAGLTEGGGADAMLEAAERRALDLTREVQEERVRLSDLKREMARRVAHAETRADRLAEENAGLILELDARPQVKEVRALQRHVEILRGKVAKLGGEQGTDVPFATSQANAKSSYSTFGRAAAEKMGTREVVARDRKLHALGLDQGVASIPKEVLVNLVQDVCLALEVGDPTVLPGAVARLLTQVADVPRQTGFIDEVCDAVLTIGRAHLPQGHHPGHRAGVPEVLKAWVAQLDDARDVRRAVLKMAKALASRVHPKKTTMASVNGDSEEHSHVDVDVALVLRVVEETVRSETGLLGASQTLRDAEALLTSTTPEALADRFVQHFMHLFGLKSLDGVLPCVNRVYSELEGTKNALKQVADALGLGPSPPLAHVVGHVHELVLAAGQDPEELRSLSARIASEQAAARAPKAKAGPDAFVGVVLGDGDVLWERRGGAPVVPIRLAKAAKEAKVGEWAEEDDREEKGEESDDYDEGRPYWADGVAEAKAGRGPTTTATTTKEKLSSDDSASPLSYEEMRELRSLFAATSDAELVTMARRAVDRLQRLDGLMPRYQGLVGRLLELLRLKELDEIVPAIMDLVK